MKKVLAALCMIVLFCIVFLSISGCTEEEKTEEANQSNYGIQQCFEHNFGMYLVEIAPTCTEKGIESAYCAVCGEKSVREIQPLGHDLEGLTCEGRHCTRCDHAEEPTTHVYDNIEEIPADCFNSGWTTYSCECGDSYMEEIPALGHAFGEWQVSTPSTCIKEGVEKRVCERCLAEETRSLPLAEHDFGEWTATVSPTCTEPGSKNRACSVCGHTETVELPAVGHKYVLVEERSATCAENGKKIFECSVCHDIKEEITGEKLNHDFGGAAPCAEGVITCIRCGKERLALPHSHATRETAPTCTESGYIEEYCTECGKIFEKSENAEPSGHDWNSGEATTAATCTEDGVKTYTCLNCGDTRTETIPAAGHSFTEYVSDNNATCTEDGTETATCDNCTATDTRVDVGSATGHDFCEWQLVKAPTCTEPGVQTRVCIRCGAEETRDTAVAEHNFSEWVITRAPTCTEPGTEEKVCRNCGDAETRIAKAAGHDFGEALPCEEGVVCIKCGAAMPTVPHTCATRGKEATCTESGYTETYCTVCGKVIGERTESAALGHDYGEWETDIAATCEEEGSETHSCKICGTVEKRVIPATGHKWITLIETSATESAEGVIIYMCSVCEATRQETIPKIEHVHDYDYVSIYGVGVACSCGRVNANEGNVIIDSSNTVSGIREGSGGVIVVPNTAYAVNWESVFCYNSQIEYIYFGKNITAIDNLFAFEGCDNLKAIYVSSECYIPVVPDFWPDMEIIRVDYNS